MIRSTTADGMRIGEVAERIGVTTRTLRYYEEVGLVTPTSRSTGGTRRYSEQDYARVLRIRELQALMGFNLDEVRETFGDAIRPWFVANYPADEVESDAPVVFTGIRLVGRPSLNGDGVSPRLSFRVPRDLYDAAMERAIEDETTVSEVTRKALEKCLAE